MPEKLQAAVLDAAHQLACPLPEGRLSALQVAGHSSEAHTPPAVLSEAAHRGVRRAIRAGPLSTSSNLLDPSSSCNT